MSFTEQLLDPPSYGYFQPDGQLYVPTRRELLREFFSRLDPRHPHHWLALLAFTATLVLAACGVLFLVFFLNWAYLGIALLYGAFAMGSHANFWIHRYCTHHAFQFTSPIARALARNLVIKTVPEELHVISHHVHHKLAEKPGDPYNAHGGFLYCFLADVNHQSIAKDFSPESYTRVRTLMAHTGVNANSYAQYKKWGSICHPAFSIAHYLANWAFWAALFLFLGGIPLMLAMFGAAGFWAIGYRTFNYAAHGEGRDLRRAGSDFHTADLSVNRALHGVLTGEWHNNHHLYPRSARAGFLPHQLDLPWLLISALKALGQVHHVRDYREQFFHEHWAPFVCGRAKFRELAKVRARQGAWQSFGS